MTKTASKLMPLADESLAAVSGARHLRLRKPGYFKQTEQSSEILNLVGVEGDGNSVSISNTVTQSA